MLAKKLMAIKSKKPTWLTMTLLETSKNKRKEKWNKKFKNDKNILAHIFSCKTIPQKEIFTFPKMNLNVWLYI